MTYDTFSLYNLKQRFGLRTDETTEIFRNIAPFSISSLLQENLRENVSLALAISTEKSRSEMIIAPILIEVRRQLQRRVSLFSGVDFTVDNELGLRGVCDYLLSLSPEQLFIEAPVVVVVEAKNENLKQGICQCIAELVAAQLFNQRRNNPITTVYGVVTTGSTWKFLHLTGTTVCIDLNEYYINDVERIVGILVHMLQAARAV